MTTFHNFKIEVWPHVLENTEELLERADLLLSTLSGRCNDAADGITEKMDREELQKITGFLYEIGLTLQFVTASLESHVKFLGEIRQKEVDQVSLTQKAA